MKKQFKHQPALLILISVCMIAGLYVQGCSNSGNGFITGPVSDRPAGEESFAGISGAPDRSVENSMIDPILLPEPCATDRTAEVQFASYNREVTYMVIVNEEKVGLLKPLNRLTVTAKEGTVAWQLEPIDLKPVYQPQFGKLTVKRCGHYVVKVDFDIMRLPEPEHEAQ